MRPALWPAARASAALMPAGGVTRIVSKNLSDLEVQPSFSRPASRRVADCARRGGRGGASEECGAELRGPMPSCAGEANAPQTHLHAVGSNLLEALGPVVHRVPERRACVW